MSLTAELPETLADLTGHAVAKAIRRAAALDNPDDRIALRAATLILRFEMHVGRHVLTPA